ncbi:MAG: hypothetical protein KKH94_10975 [Candidatus Omnitrophica bacterium]|nr:hypothetical protein [Candidatus Omnitrophota bacterium]
MIKKGEPGVVNVMSSFFWRKRWLVRGLVLTAMLIAVSQPFAMPSSFDANEVAVAETNMWKAYYTGNAPVLVGHLVGLLHSQFDIPLQRTQPIAGLLAKAAMNFRMARSNYDVVVLPDLKKAYYLLQQALDESFDPERVARADLAWWVARRTPGQNSPETVGKKIAAYYTALYGKNHPDFQNAGILRAKAADVRDASGKQVNWQQIEKLLKQSYTVLVRALSA